MRELKLTISLEPGIKSELINHFGSNYNIVGDKMKFIQFTFKEVRILSAFKLTPILQLLNTFESAHQQLYFKMFHLKDDIDGSFSPMYIQCTRGEWSLVTSTTGKEERSSNSVFSLI